ncbi:MAG: T9SS type A sorting domain-containing protein [Bacteroidia bacterium]
MKKHILGLSVIALAFTINTTKAQLINPDFTTWTHTAASVPIYPLAFDDPNSGLGSNGWWEFNPFTSALIGSSPTVSVFKDSTLVYPGSKYSCEITSVVLSSTSYGYVKSFIPHDTTGVLLCGNFSTSAPYIHLGLPDSGRIVNSLSFYYQYAPASASGKPDTAFCSVTLSHFSGGKHHVLGSGKVTLNSASSWTLGTVSVQWDSLNPHPDTILILFSSSSFYKPVPGSILYLDQTSIVLGVNEISAPAVNVAVFPNPASTEVNFKISSTEMANHADIYDITGQKVNSYEVRDNLATINTASYATGLYIYQLYDKSGNVMKIGKFSVTR